MMGEHMFEHEGAAAPYRRGHGRRQARDCAAVAGVTRESTDVCVR
jgi:hypothetical protein